MSLMYFYLKYSLIMLHSEDKEQEKSKDLKEFVCSAMLMTKTLVMLSRCNNISYRLLD